MAGHADVRADSRGNPNDKPYRNIEASFPSASMRAPVNTPQAPTGAHLSMRDLALKQIIREEVATQAAKHGIVHVRLCPECEEIIAERVFERANLIEE